MWNKQCDNILQKEFGFYFGSDNRNYPNVWIKSVIDTSRDVSPRRTSPISDSKKSHEPSVIFSRASWIISRS